jgi:hypothetical protein
LAILLLEDFIAIPIMQGIGHILSTRELFWKVLIKSAKARKKLENLENWTTALKEQIFLKLYTWRLIFIQNSKSYNNLLC